MIPKLFMLNFRSVRPFRRALGLFALVVCTVIFGLLAKPEDRIPSSGLKPAAAASGSLPELRGPAAVERLKQEGSYSSLAAAMAAARYQFVWETRPLLRGVGPAYHAPNRAQGFHTYFTREGARLAEFSPQRDEPAGRARNPQWQLALKLKGYGYGERQTPLSLCGIEARQNRVEYTHYPAVASDSAPSAVTEWYLNQADGLEQGFTIGAAPGSASDGQPLRLTLEISGDLRAELSADGQAISLRDPRSRTSLDYRNLKAWDARGHDLPARMRLEGNEIALEVDDAGAVYPLTIDPLLSQQAKLTANDGAAGDQLGSSVAISGDTAVVGARLDDVGANADQGSAYVFVRNGTVWAQQQRLSASDGAASDQFGASVAISGDTVVVGANLDDTGATLNHGSAYVFVRSGTSWTQQQKLLAIGGAAGDQSGFSVAISCDTVVVGAVSDDVTNTDQGSAYVFTRSGTSWAQQQQIIATDGAAFDFFGQSVAISGDTAVIGAYGDDGVANLDQGSAYVFVRSGTSWTQQQKLLASDGAAGDLFGFSVAISGDTIVIGAASDSVGVTLQGSAYVFVRSGTGWTQQQQLIASDGAASDLFGHSVAISGDTIVIGTPLDGAGANIFQGSAYVFVRSRTNWAPQQKLTAGDGAPFDNFGQSVAISGDTAVIGAYGDDVGLNENQGSAYIFVCGVCPAITLNPATLPNGAPGASYNQNLTASGGSEPYRLSLSAGSLPPGLSLTQDGQIAGTPVTAGTYNFTITATAANLCVGSRSYTLVINCLMLTFTQTATALPTGLVGVPYSRAFVVVCGAAPYTFSVASGILPGGLSLSPSGVLSGTPLASGAFSFTVRARDVNNCEGSQTYTLTVIQTTLTTRIIRVAAAGGSPGNTVAVPIELVSQGNENALGLSLNFDPAVLSNPRPALGGDAAGATLNFNTSQAASGRLGLTLALASNTTFIAGVRQVFVVTFDIAAGVTARSTPIEFGDQPVIREVVSATVGLFPANYPPGVVTITPGLEADVAPRPNGNGAVTVLDWVQAGRFAAKLDAAAVGSEFQRADCAPKDTKGDGSLTVADWAQAGRYAAGLDPLMPVGGPTAPVTPLVNTDCRAWSTESSSCNPSLAFDATTKPPSRLISGASSPGSGAITVTLDGGGDENALGFSLIFNPSQWRYVSATAGSGAADAALQINISQVARGRLGLALALPAGRTFEVGAQQLIELNFAPAQGDGQPPALAIGFADAPVEREVVAADTRALAARFAVEMSGGAPGSLTSVSAASFRDGDLAREQIVAAFGANLTTQTAAATGLPLPTDLAGARAIVTDSRGVARPAPLFFVSPGQINYQIPPETADGVATVTIIHNDNPVALGVAAIAPVSPALFTADASGAGLPAASLLRVDPAGNLSYEAVARFDQASNRFAPAPINLGAEGDEVFLLLYGTGIRGRSQLTAVSCALGGVTAEVSYAGEVTGFVGLDQLNVKLPRALAGRGDVDVVLRVDGVAANVVRVNIR